MVKIFNNMVSYLINLLPWKIRQKKNSLPPANVYRQRIKEAGISHCNYKLFNDIMRNNYLAVAVPKRTANS